MWVFKGGPPDKQSVVFKYHPTRSGFVAQDFLKGFKGYVQSDGYAGYNFVAADKYMYQLYCMAHARRKFVEVVKLAKSKGLAHVALKMITELYKIEREARQKGLNPDERYALRQEKSKPIMDKLKAWLDEHIQTILPKSPTGKAMGYMLKHWEGLYRYLESGHVEIDNNGVENVIRPLALGRKYYLWVAQVVPMRLPTSIACWPLAKPIILIRINILKKCSKTFATAKLRMIIASYCLRILLFKN